MSPDHACDICGKKFDNPRSRIRHSSYCRKRARNPPKPRKRSCLGCTKAKTYCDARLPACSRCLERSLNCRYEQWKHRAPQSDVRSEHSEQASSPSIGTSPSSDSSIDSSLLVFDDTYANTTDLPFDAIPDLGGNLDIENDRFLHEDSFALNDSRLCPTVPIQNLPEDVEHGFSTILWSGKAASEEFGLSTKTNSMDSWAVRNFSPLGRELTIRAPRSFWPKRLRYRQLSLLQKYVVRTLSAYPHALQPGKSTPPFIHPRFLVDASTKDGKASQPTLTGSLAACSGVIAMWAMKSTNNTDLIWRVIRMEQERLSRECSTYDDWEAVAAFQAITIYFLLRLTETNEDVTSFDIPLIRTMTQLATKVKGITARHRNSTVDGIPVWRDWILVESLRRTIYVLFIVSLLFDISAGTQHMDCSSAKEWPEMLLPSTKGLWAAQTRKDFQSECMKEQAEQHPAFGDLLRHNEEPSLSETSIDDWLGQTDEFGALVIAVASLVEGIEKITPWVEPSHMIVSELEDA